MIWRPESGKPLQVGLTPGDTLQTTEPGRFWLGRLHPQVVWVEWTPDSKASAGGGASAPPPAGAVAEDGFRRTYRLPAGLEPERERQALHLAALWSEKVTPLRVLNQQRFSAILARLCEDYDQAVLAEAVAAYGADDWHREKNAWLDLADFFRPKHLDRWIREAEARRLARQKKELSRPAADRRVRSLVGDLARSKQALAQEESLLSAFAGWSEGRRLALLSQAVRDLSKINPRLSASLRATLHCPPVRRRVLDLLEGEENLAAQKVSSQEKGASP
jgi:hypothetical protein